MNGHEFAERQVARLDSEISRVREAIEALMCREEQLLADRENWQARLGALATEQTAAVIPLPRRFHVIEGGLA